MAAPCAWPTATWSKHLDRKLGPVSHFRRVLVLYAMFLLAGNGVFSSSVHAIDPHRIYEQRCGGCHAPHAGDFAHESLISSNGRIYGRRSGEELHGFLEAGHGGLSDEETRSMIEHLTHIKNAGRLFHDKCRICHGRAVGFARQQLYLKDGKLAGRYSKRDTERFLHGTGASPPTRSRRWSRRSGGT